MKDKQKYINNACPHYFCKKQCSPRFTAIRGGQRGSAGGIFIDGQLQGDGWKIAVVKRGVPRVCVENLFHRGHRVLPLDHSSRWCVEVGKNTRAVLYQYII